MIGQNLRARYSNGVITPSEPVDLPEGCAVTVNVPASAAAADAPAPASPSPAHSHKPRILDIIEEIHREFPPDQLGGTSSRLRPQQWALQEALPLRPPQGSGLVRTVFADAGYWIALLQPRDRVHRPAQAMAVELADDTVVTTDMVLVEVSNRCRAAEGLPAARRSSSCCDCSRIRKRRSSRQRPSSSAPPLGAMPIDQTNAGA